MKYSAADVLKKAFKFLFLISTFALGYANAQTYPNKSVILIAPQPAGSGVEAVLRSISTGIGNKLGQSVIVDYKPGANGNIGAAALANAAPDGYTWMLGQETIKTVNPQLYTNIGFDKERVMPVALVGSFTQILVCNASTGIKSAKDFFSKVSTGKLTYASSGAGSPAHLTMEWFLDEIKAQMTHIPYRGPQPAIQDLLGGQVDCAFLIGGAVIQHVKSGKLVALASSGKKRSWSLPDVPTVTELGYPNFDATFWLTMFAPRGTSQEAISKFGKALQETIVSSVVQEAMKDTDIIPEGSTPQIAQRELESISNRWGQLIARLRLKVD